MPHTDASISPAEAARRSQVNTRIVNEAGIEYEVTGDFLAIRRPGLSADFYPATGRWKHHTGKRGKWYRGGAGRFVTWLAARLKETEQTEFVARPAIVVAMETEAQA